MPALQADLDLALSVQREGVTSNLLAESLTLTDEAFDEQAVHLTEVPDGAVDQAVSLGPLTTAQLVLLIADQVVTVKLNGEAAGHACKLMLLESAAITGLSLSNASGSQAVVRTYLLGT